MTKAQTVYKLLNWYKQNDGSHEQAGEKKQNPWNLHDVLDKKRTFTNSECKLTVL